MITIGTAGLPGRDVVRSERLDLVSVGADFMRAVLEGRIQEAESLASVKLRREWLGEAPHLLRLRLEQLERDPDQRPWLLRLIVLRATNEMIGHVNFHEPPGDRNWVEIGYWISPSHRRRGYALETARAMFRWARERGVGRFRASVSPVNEASLALVQRMGFRRIGVQWDEIDGEEIVFEVDAEGLLGGLG